jgi:glycolate oxidase
MSLALPAADPAILARRGAIARRLRAIVGAEAVIEEEAGRRAYESDGLTAYAALPLLVVLPATTAEVAAVLRFCHAQRIPVVPRGAGTSLSGGALPLEGGVLLGLARMSRILSVDYESRVAVVQPGVTNLAVTKAVEGRGFYYAPDPSSQVACTVGGNLAENSGGVHCLKYGLTCHNVLAAEVVLMDGEVVRLGSASLEARGQDLLAAVIGSEGLLGVATEITVRILPRPLAARALLIGFASVEAAGRCVSEVIAAGIIPAGMEMMDAPAIRAAEAFVHAGYPTSAAALLIVEVDGVEAECAHLAAEIEAIARACGATSVRASASEAERLTFWAGRKAAFPAVGRIAPDYYCMDGTIPRKALPEVLVAIGEMAGRYGLGVANVFHAGDGNLHPLILYDVAREGDLAKAEAFGAEILKLCVAKGGVLTGEHGVGVEKRGLMGEMFGEADLACQQRVKCAFDPELLLNPGKVFPVLRRCAELGRLHVHAGRLPHPELERF